MADAARSIGRAVMDPDGTVHIFLRAESAQGDVGDAMFSYPPNHPRYQEILDHLGGLQPGEEKPVPPWAEEDNEDP